MNDTDELRAAAQQALVALVHHTEQTRPIQRTADAIEALRAALAQPAAPVVERADSATPVVERSAGNVSDNAAPVEPAEPASKPVARLLVWHGPKHLPVPPPAARTYAEFSEDSAGPQKQGAYWHNGTPLYAAPQPAPARVPPGWQLVPVEPTPEMVHAVTRAESRHMLEDRKRGGFDPHLGWSAAYRAMLAAAPTAQQEPKP